MVYWFGFLTQYKVFITTGGGVTGVSRRRYFDPYSSVFFRYTPVLPICRSAPADLLRTITAAFSGTIVAEFSDFVLSALLNVGDLSSDCAT
nr:hypothetical protein R10p_00002 [Serratia proteamaculans]